MPGPDDNLGKKAEAKIREWLNRPEEGYSFYRLPDQQSGLYGSTNPCDFIVYKEPYEYWIESKATWHDRFDFSMITDYQRDSLLARSAIKGVHGVVIVLFATQKRAFWLDIRDIVKLMESGVKSINITKIKNWTIPYKEIVTVYNTRKQLLDYAKDGNVI